MRTETRVNHKDDVERLLRFRFEDVNFLLNAFFENLKRFLRKIGSGPILIVKHAHQDIYEIDAYADAAPLGCAVPAFVVRFLGIVTGGGFFSGSRTSWLGFLCPWRAIRIVLRSGTNPEERELDK